LHIWQWQAQKRARNRNSAKKIACNPFSFLTIFFQNN